MDSLDRSDLSAEPSILQGLTSAQKDRLTEILDRYLAALESGAPLSREALLAENADLAEPLQSYFERLDELHDLAGGFGGGARHAEPPPAAPGERRLGDFRLGREVGRGGMGVVYEAWQISLGRRVALKVLPFAAVLDARQIARFKHEAQAAAQLNHPHIVPVFAVGVERGVHYFAMHFVDGQPLDRALAELRHGRTDATAVTLAGQPAAPEADASATVPLDLAAEADLSTDLPAETPTIDYRPSTRRSSLQTTLAGNRREYFLAVARLGIQAAEALHTAHEHGVVHRDVKPSNLLLDGEGKLWVTDFGLARCRTDATLTRTGEVIGTLRYMSPEQAAGNAAAVDHRTDIYSLGVTLYELLALQPAYPGDDGPSLLRAIEQAQPRRLRDLQPRIPPDLETVIFKALAKRSEERYATAQDFADDLRRVIEGKPTVARPPTPLERLAAWGRQRQRTVAIAAVLCLAAALGMTASTLLIAREKAIAERNFNLAEQNFRQARDVVGRLGAGIAERLFDVPGAQQVRREMLQLTLHYYADFARQAENNPALQSDLATAYIKMGVLNTEMGANEDAAEANRKAIAILQRLVEEHPAESDYRSRLAESQDHLGLILSHGGRSDDARRAFAEAIRLQEALVHADPADSTATRYLALAHSHLGLLQSETGDTPPAEEAYHEAIRLLEQLLVREPHNPDYQRDLAAALNNLGALDVAAQPERAAEIYQRVLTYQTQAAAARPGDWKLQSDLALTCNNLGAVQARAGQLPAAAASYARAVEIWNSLVQAVPAQKMYRYELAITVNNLGLTESRLHQASAAETSFRRALELQNALVVQNPHEPDLQSKLGGIYNNLGMVLEELNQRPEAAECYRQAIEHQQVAASRATAVSQYRHFLSRHYFNYGRVLRALGRPAEAARAALARRDLWPNDPQHLVAVAEELALAAGQLSTIGPTASGVPPGGMSAGQCGESAIETLRQARSAGWKPSAEVAQNAAFAAVKKVPGFAAVISN